MRSDPNESAPTSAQPEEPLEPLRAAITASERDLTPNAAAFVELQAAIAHDESSALHGVRSRSTVARRSALLGALVLMAGAELWMRGREALHVAPLRVGVSLAVLGGLVVLAAWLSTRPLHAPLLSRRREIALLCAPLAITLALSLWPSGHVDDSLQASLAGATPCFVYGGVVALIVFLLARAIDRGAWFSAVSAALSAGLFANFALMTHCPSAGFDHMLLGHFGVLLVAVTGCALWLRLRDDR